MPQHVIQFLLVPDSSAARRVRRAIAVVGARAGVQVGTWIELLELAQRAYLIADRLDNWGEVVSRAFAVQADAFWADSYVVTPDETRDAVESAYTDLVSALASTNIESNTALEHLPERVQRHVSDLVGLSGALAGALPHELGVLVDLLATDAVRATHQICVVSVNGVRHLPIWQRQLISKLNEDANSDPDQALTSILETVLNPSPSNTETTVLQTLQSALYANVDVATMPDDSVQWIGVRDFLAEAEVAAGMVQSLLDSNSELVASEIGVLIPDSFEYALAVSDAFEIAGLPLSGLPAERWRRDHGRELVLHFLYCRQKPTPAMALAACLSSPLMPWSREDGAYYAQRVMDGDYRLMPMREADAATRAVFDLIRQGDEDAQTLKTALNVFAELIVGDDDPNEDLIRAKLAAGELAVAIGERHEIEWTQLRRQVTPKYLPSGEAPDFNLEGVTVWREPQEPWRSVQHLLVLGFAKGHYPTAVGTSSVFAQNELSLLNEALAVALPTPGAELTIRRKRFVRQLLGASESVAFLVPRRGANGEPTRPSESLVFMAKLLGRGGDADALILDLDDAQQRARVRHLAQAPLRRGEPASPIGSQDLDFQCDLLALRKDDSGHIRPESPSGLEKLMVSPLAWLLSRLGAEPLGWAPESPNVMLLGSLAHRVFEGLFAPDTPLPDESTIAVHVETFLDNAIREMAPFLRAAQWQIERRNLVSSLVKAARGWVDVIRRLNAQILAGEERLAGEFHNTPIHGQADLILGLNDGSLLVVDYKRSSSGSRRGQMMKGYDSQASLYRTMLQTGGSKDAGNDALRRRLSESDSIGVVYYMLNDQTALSDTALATSGSIPRWDVPGSDISSNAISLISTRLDEVAKGLIRLNCEEDEKFFEQTAGMKPYALGNSPMVGLFMGPGLMETLG